MELLDLLENRISDLLERLESLESENKRLKGELMQGRDTLLAENQSLKTALEDEKNNKAVVLRRIDVLLSKLKDQAGEG
jgi:cell division septum initiation protein DivIVA